MHEKLNIISLIVAHFKVKINLNVMLTPNVLDKASPLISDVQNATATRKRRTDPLAPQAHEFTSHGCFSSGRALF